MNELVQKKVRQAIHRSDYDGVVVGGLGSFAYLTGCVPPLGLSRSGRMAVAVQTEEGSGSIVCPFDWIEAFRDQGWDGEVHTYSEAVIATGSDGLVQAVSAALKFQGLDNARLGVDMSGVSGSLMKGLTRSNGGVAWMNCDRLLAELRMIKTSGEVRFLEQAANQAEKGMIGALNHLEGAVEGAGYSLAEFAERVRVHVIEFGGSGIGHLTTLQGDDARVHYAPPRGVFRSGNLIRVDLTNHHLGYWSSAGWTVAIGLPDSRQIDAYQDNLRLKAVAEAGLRPGVRCSRLFGQVEEVARRKGIHFWPEVGIGHGVGTSDWEPPFLGASDNTALKPGMVVAIDVFTYGPCGELLHSKDTYEITGEGSRLLSWYKRWDELYAVTGSRARH